MTWCRAHPGWCRNRTISARGSPRGHPTRRAKQEERVMRHISNGIAVAAVVVLLLAGAAGAVDPPGGPLEQCPVDALVSGAGCMDKHEASVWRGADTANAQTESDGRSHARGATYRPATS